MNKSLELKDMLKGDVESYLSAMVFLEESGILTNKEYFKKFKEIVMIVHHNGYIEGLEFAKEEYIKNHTVEEK